MVGSGPVNPALRSGCVALLDRGARCRQPDPAGTVLCPEHRAAVLAGALVFHTPGFLRGLTRILPEDVTPGAGPRTPMARKAEDRVAAWHRGTLAPPQTFFLSERIVLFIGVGAAAHLRLSFVEDPGSVVGWCKAALIEGVVAAGDPVQLAVLPVSLQVVRVLGAEAS